MTSEEPEQPEERGHVLRETITVILLGVTAVLTAWSGFEASKWGGEMSIAFSRASTQRIEASTYAGEAQGARAIDLQVFGLYLQGYSEGNDQLEDFARERFTPHFAVAFDEWFASEPLKNPDAAPSPFALESYVPPGQVESAEADAHADALFARALANNQRGDNYTILTVLFALVLFFGAFANRFKTERIAWVMVISATVLMCVGIGFLLSFPKII